MLQTQKKGLGLAALSLGRVRTAPQRTSSPEWAFPSAGLAASLHTAVTAPHPPTRFSA